MTPQESVGKTFGCMYVDRVDLERLSNGHTRSVCSCHCIHCGTSHRYHFSSLLRNPPNFCKNCPSEFRKYPSNDDLSGNDFPSFRVIRREGPAIGLKTLWLCTCKVCGRECLIQQRYLKVYKSCGCLMKDAQKAGQDFCRELAQRGTSYAAIRPQRALNRNNQSGVRGVCKGTNRAWRAYISIRRTSISLGEYDRFEDAVRARKEAEAKYFKPEIDTFEADGYRLKGPYQKKSRKKDPNP